MKSKKNIIKYLLVFLLIIYYGFEAKDMQIIDSLDFFKTYSLCPRLLGVKYSQNQKNNV